MPYYRRSVSAILVLLIVMGCAGLTAFSTSGRQVVYTSVAYYTAAESHQSLMDVVMQTAYTVFSSTSDVSFYTYIDAQHSTNGEYVALFFDGQMITVPQLRGDSADGNAQITKIAYMQPGRCIVPAEPMALHAPLHLTTKENVELLM